MVKLSLLLLVIVVKNPPPNDIIWTIKFGDYICVDGKVFVVLDYNPVPNKYGYNYLKIKEVL